MLYVKAKITFEISFLLILNVVYSKVILFIFSKVLTNFKIYERVISALKFELSGKRSQILVVNSCEWMKVLKFTKNKLLFLKIQTLFFRFFYSKERQGDLNYEAVPLSPFRSHNPLARSKGMQMCFALHAFYYRASVWQILKFHERVISALKFELSCKRSQILVANSCEWMKVLKFANLLRQTYKCQINFKICKKAL